MTEFDYPPSRTYELGSAVESLESEIESVEAEIEELESDADSDSEDGDNSNQADLRDAQSRKRTLENQRDGLNWLIDQYDEDTSITLTAYTARSRSQVLDVLQNQMMGQVGEARVSDWITAAGVTDAPWIDDDSDLTERCLMTEKLPPAVMDWLEAEQEELNDLSEGNS